MKTFIHLATLYGFNKILKFTLFEIRLLCYRFIYKSYSQNKEDLIIEKIIGKKKSGKYIDIGANDPIRFNNTYKFYKMGWSGANIEPNIKKYETLKSKRYRDLNLNIAISEKSESVDFYNFNPDTLSTISAAVAKQYQDMGFIYLGVRTVVCSTLAEITDLVEIDGDYDLLTIDTEGSELEILKTNIWSRNRPHVVCVETINFNDNNERPTRNIDIIKFLLDQRYTIHRHTKSNTIFIRNDSELF